MTVFIDWLSMAQVHAIRLPVVNDGRVIAIDMHGQVEYETDRKMPLEGSHDTKLRVRCDGFRVEVDGNIGRFNRPDNLFGLTYEQCVEKWSRILRELGLPGFSPGIPMIRQRVGRTSRLIEHTGAVNTRIDVTKNYTCGNDELLNMFMNHLGAQQLSRTKAGTKTRDGSVTWGEGSRFVYEILYDKFRELIRHSKGLDHIERVADWCKENGIARHECKFKTRYLTQKHLRFLAETSHDLLVEEYNMRAEKLFSQIVQWDTLNDIPKPFRATAKDWVDGVDLASTMSLRTFFRHRSYLKQFGFDISMTPPNIEERQRLITPVKVEIRDAVAPDWYWSESQELLKAA